MTSSDSEPQAEKIQQEKEYGDSATAVTPDTQQPPQGERVDNGDEDSAGDGDDTGAQGADANTMPDDADAESGFYG